MADERILTVTPSLRTRDHMRWRHTGSFFFFFFFADVLVLVLRRRLIKAARLSTDGTHSLDPPRSWISTLTILFPTLAKYTHSKNSFPPCEV